MRICECHLKKANFGLFSTVLVCRRFGLSPFRFVAVLVVAVSVCRRFDLNPEASWGVCCELISSPVLAALLRQSNISFYMWAIGQLTHASE